MSTQLKKGVLEMVVLSKISMGDTYGYDIYQEISQNMAISESTIYPILRKLTKEGYMVLRVYYKDASRTADSMAMKSRKLKRCFTIS